MLPACVFELLDMHLVKKFAFLADRLLFLPSPPRLRKLLCGRRGSFKFSVFSFKGYGFNWRLESRPR
jgi:hypothetical protein